MRFLVDEDVDIAVGGLLANRGHDVGYVVQVLGSGAKDPIVRRLRIPASMKGVAVILSTADNEFAARCGQKGSRLPCLWLRDLQALEFDRATDLCDRFLVAHSSDAEHVSLR